MSVLRRMWGYYTPTPPCEGVTPSCSLWGYYPHTPTLLLYPSFMHPFCQGIAPKKFARKARKIFRALDNDDKLKSKHARSGLPPRALVAI